MGSSLVLHVSPLDTVFDVKTYIQKLEGIPASQQHLVFQTCELHDEQSLQDCHLHSGATLRLVLNMRGGPINTRRVPIEEPTLVEYFTEASRSDLLSSASSHHRPVTVVVCHSGDQLKFYQLMPGSDVASPVSCSQSSSEDDVEVDQEHAKPTRERREENRRTRDKMKLVRSRMERCSLLKESKDQLPTTKSLLPRPLSTGRPVYINRLRHPSTSVTSQKPALHEVDASSCTRLITSQKIFPKPSDCPEKHLQTSDTVTASSQSFTAGEVSVHRQGEVSKTVVKSTNSSCLLTSETDSKCVREEDYCGHSELNTVDAVDELKPTVPTHNTSAVKSDRLNVGQRRVEPVNSCKLLRSAESVTKSIPAHGSKSVLSLRQSLPDQSRCDLPRRQLNEARSKFASALASSEQPAPTAAGKRTRARKDGSVMLRSLDSSEVRVMSGVLTSLMQSKNSPLSSAGCYQTLRSGKHRSSLDVKTSAASYSKPSAPMVTKSAEKTEAVQQSSVTSSTHLPVLPAVSAPKTSTKRCQICRKKTSLATSFQCRCGGNFCSWHRNAESHSCSFDYRSEGRRLIAQTNPLVTAEKLPKI